jgi:hypothetical protein
MALIGAPVAAVLYDQIRDWQAAFALLAAGTLPTQGATISGVGANGPLYYLLLMAGQVLAVTEVGMARFVTVLALLGAFVWVLTARTGEDRRIRAWIGIAIASHPLALEWVRLGADFSYLPVLLPLGALVYHAVEQRPQQPRRWLLWGLVCGAALQLHVTTAPLLLAASWTLWRTPRRPWAPVLVVIGAALTYAWTIPSFEAGATSLSWWQLPTTAAKLGYALVAAAAVPAGALGIAGLAGAWTTLALLAVALGAWRRADAGSRFLGAVAVASLAFVSFDPQSHYNHLMHLDMVLVFGLAAGARRLTRGPAGKALITLIVLFQCAVSIAAIREAGQTGLVRRYTAFPLEWPAVTEIAATAELRDQLVAQLRAEGLTTPWQRLHLLSGDTLPFVEHGWVFYRDPSPVPSFRDDPPAAPAFVLRRGTCGPSAGYDLPGHCLARMDRSPAAMRVVLADAQEAAPDPLSRRTLADARHAWARERRAFPDAMAPLIIDWADNFPKQIEPIDPSQRISLVKVRQFRFPDARAELGDVGIVAAARVGAEATTHGYLLVERRLKFSEPVTRIVLDVTDGADRGAFDLDIELTTAGSGPNVDGVP